MSAVFESKPCGRCGGSGKYSFNQMDGDRCYGCVGTGATLTKRGAAARAFFLASLKRPAGEVVVGMQVYDYAGLSASRRWHRVEAVRLDTMNPNSLWLDLVWKTHRVAQGVGLESLVLCVASDAERAAKLDAALAYQATLTKEGKPSARAAKARAAADQPLEPGDFSSEGMVRYYEKARRDRLARKPQ